MNQQRMRSAPVTIKIFGRKVVKNKIIQSVNEKKRRLDKTDTLSDYRQSVFETNGKTTNLVRYIVNDDDSVSTSVVTGRNCTESLLTGGIPLRKQFVKCLTQSRVSHTDDTTVHVSPPVVMLTTD